MRLRYTTFLLVAVTLLLPAGCAAPRGQMSSRRQVNTAQLLAAARHYEKEGNLQSAGRIYRHVLQFHPANSEAKQGLALVQQGKLRVDYDAQQLLASTDPTIQRNPQARQQLARMQQAQREQVDERMAQLISQAANNPQKIEVDPTPATTIVAAAASPAPPVAPQPIRQANVARTAEIASPKIVQTNAVASQSKTPAVKTSNYVKPQDETPADWKEDSWQSHSLVGKCTDASAEILDLVKLLESKADADRKDALAKLARLGPEAISAAPAVRCLLRDQNQLVSAHAAWAIWEIEGDAQTSTKVLQDSLSSASTDVVHFATYTLGNVGDLAESAVPQLRKLLGSDNSFTSLHAAEALMKISAGTDRDIATDTLIVLLKDNQPGVRHLAALALGEVDESNAEVAIAALIDALNDKDAGVRSAAALSLGGFQTGTEEAVKILEGISQTDHTDVRQAALTALACLQS